MKSRLASPLITFRYRGSPSTHSVHTWLSRPSRYYTISINAIMYIYAQICKHEIATLFEEHPKLWSKEYYSRRDPYCSQCGSEEAGKWLLAKATALVPPEVRATKADFLQTEHVDATRVEEELEIFEANPILWDHLEMPGEDQGSTAPAFVLWGPKAQSSQVQLRVDTAQEGLSSQNGVSSGLQGATGTDRTSNNNAPFGMANRYPYLDASLREHRRNGWLADQSQVQQPPEVSQASQHVWSAEQRYAGWPESSPSLAGPR